MKRTAQFFLLLTFTVFFVWSKPRVGALDFTAKNTSKQDAEVVGEMFRSELVDSGAFIVLERNNMNSLLKEQEFQQTGCTESSCAVQIGKMLNMEYMFYGTLMKLGKQYSIAVNMVNIESSKIVKTAKEQFTALEDASAALKKIVTSLAREDAIALSTRQRQSSLDGVFRNAIIGGSLLALGAGTWIAGDAVFGAGAQLYTSRYNGNPNTVETSALHDELSGYSLAADTLYVISETSLIVSAVFVVWGVFDFIMYQGYDGRLRELRADSIQIRIAPSSLAVALTHRF